MEFECPMHGKYLDIQKNTVPVCPTCVEIMRGRRHPVEAGCLSCSSLRAELEGVKAELEEARKPTWACRSCGYSGEGFFTIKYEITGEPTEYDIGCPNCESTECSESIEEALRSVSLELDNTLAELEDAKGKLKEKEEGK